MPHPRWIFSSNDSNNERVRRRSPSIYHIFTGLFPQMTDNNANNDDFQDKEKEIRNSDLTTATIITTDSNVTNEKNALLQAVEDHNKEATGLGNLCSTTAYDFYNQRRRLSDLSSENNRPIQHVVNLVNVEAHDINDISTVPSNNNSIPYSNNIYYNSQSVFTRIKPTKEILTVILLPLSLFLIGLAIGIVAFKLVFAQEEKRYKDSFSFLCTQRINAIASNFISGLQTGRDFVGFFTVIASMIPDINNADEIVNKFGNLSAINNVIIRTVNFAPRIPNSERSSYEAKYGTIKKYDNLNRSVSRDYATEYFPIRYSMPWKDDTPIILNYDVSSENVRAAAILKARQTKNVTLTPRIPLAHDLNKGGIVVFFPFYRNFTSGIDGQVVPISNDVDGLVVGAYDLDQTIENVTQKFHDDKSGIGFDIIDLESNTPLYNKDNNTQWYSADFNEKEIHTIGDRSWSFTCYTSKEAYDRSVSMYAPAIYLVMITLFFAFVAFLTSNYFRKLFKARYKYTEQAARLGRTQSLLKAITADSKAVLEAIADPLVALNAKGEIVGANKHALSLTGYSPEEIKIANKMHINKLLIPVAETPMEEKNFNPLDQLIEVPVRPGMRDVLARKKDGTLFEAEAHFSQPVVEKNYFTQVVMFRDVSFKKENDRIVMDAKRDAELANQSKTEFLFFLCHEIRNPAHAILGFAEMLQNSLKEKEQFEELEYIISAGKFLSFIVNDILDLTHLTNPNPYEIELTCNGFNLHTLIDNIAKIQSIEADHKQIKVKTIIGGELPQNVYGDERRLEQVLMKLLARSIEVAPSDGIVELIIEQKKIHRSKGVLMRFSVKDQSKGLSSDEEIQELFKPYSKTNSSIGSRFHAQGLSMALAQAIVKVMGGRLVVEKVGRSSDSGSSSKQKDAANGTNHVWFEIWLLTEEAKERRKLLRESFDSTVISKSGSAGRNSFKVASAPGSTDGKFMDDAVIINTGFADNENADKSQVLLRNTKSLKSKRDSKANKSMKERRRATLTSSAAAATLNSGGEESNDEEVGSNSEALKNTTSSNRTISSATNNFFRKGSIMLASGLARASTISHQSNEKPSSSPLTANFSQNSVIDPIHRSGDKNNTIGVQIEPQECTLPPIISYYSGGNTHIPPIPPIPPIPQERNLLLSKSISTKTDSIKSKNSSNTSLPSMTNINTSQNVSMLPHSTPKSVVSAVTSTSTSSHNQPHNRHSLHITIPPPSDLTADTTPVTNITNNSDNDNSKPSASDNLAGAQVKDVNTTAAAASAPSSSSIGHQKILLVEDNLVCQRVTYKMLKRNNYLVDIANHGKEAVDMVEAIQQQQQQYACILMDIITPVMNGYEATQLLRERGVNIPILALTANSFGSELKKARDVGMNDFLTKPIKEAELISAIRKQVENYEIIGSLQNQHDDSMEISVELKDQYLSVDL